MLWFYIFEIIGTISFAISGAMVAIQKKVDIFGVIFLGVITAFGGGLIRDVSLGNVPPAMFNNTIYLTCAVVATLVVFLTASLFKEYYIKKELLFDTINNIFDALGLGAFSVVGAKVTMLSCNDANAFLIIVMGMITGMGGGLLRDLLVREIPFVLNKRVYAVAAMLGAAAYYILTAFTYNWLAMIVGVFLHGGAKRICSVFKWNLPKALD